MFLAEINKLNLNEYHRIFGNIVEHYVKIADYLYNAKPYENEKKFLETVLIFLKELPLSEKEEILKNFPDLAGKLADEGRLTEESIEEHKAAGLDKLTTLEKKELNDLNNKYKLKFGFPFVICARENKVVSILNGLKTRINNNLFEELHIGMEEVKKICLLRIKDIIEINQQY